MKKLLLTLLVPVFFTCFAVSAAEKTAVVDMQKIFTGYEKTKIVEDRLAEQLKTMRSALVKMQNDAKELKKKYDEALEGSQNLALSNEEREKFTVKKEEITRILALKDTELKEYAKNGNNQIKARYEEERTAIISEIKKVIRNKATLEGYSLVLDKSGMTMNQLNVVIYNDPSMDITQSVTDELNRLWKSAQTAAPAAK